jgi:hypothetical protein
MVLDLYIKRYMIYSMKTRQRKLRKQITLSAWAIEHLQIMAEDHGLALSTMIELLIRDHVSRKKGASIGDGHSY